MARGKDLKPRKTENYGKWTRERFLNNPDLKEKHSEQVKESRKNEKEIPEWADSYSLDETKEQILSLCPWTKGTNRKVFKDKRLYKSILLFTENLILFSDKITEKMYQIITPTDNICPHCGRSRKFNTFYEGYAKFCKYLDCVGGREELKNEWSRIAKNTWDSYSITEKEEKRKKSFTPDVRKKMSESAKRRISEGKFSKSSKAANDFFAEIIELGFEGECDVTSGERRFTFLEGDNKKTMFVDFCFCNKIIEYDGDFWHKDRSILDKERDIFLNNQGFEVIRIKHSEVKKDRTAAINKALEFLSCG